MLTRRAPRQLALALAAALTTTVLHASSGVSIEWREADTPPSQLLYNAAPESAHADVWDRIRAGFKIADDTHPLVATHEAWYAARPEHMARIVERARRYLYHIVESVEARSMPTELALLPIVESAFVATAQSPSAASGIWQFIPSTGRLYGLTQNDWYDGRRDFPEATRAALDYLGKLYLDFGDWRLALAAYNCGEGCVARAIQKNVEAGLPTDYASLPLPAETRNYVPKLMAVKNVIADPQRFNLVLDSVPNTPYFDVVSVPPGLDFPAAARLANVSHAEFLALNAGYPQGVIRADTPARVLVPVDRVPDFQRSVDSGEWDKWQTYPVEKGLAVAELAQRVGTTVERLERHNQLNLKRGRFVRDQIILVPVSSGKPVPAVSTATRRPALDTLTTHTVEQGETFYSIARRYGLTLDTLRDSNPGVSVHLALGQQLLLPPTVSDVGFQPVSVNTPRADSQPRQSRKKPATTRHTIKRGDTLTEIAQRYDVSVSDLKSWNRSLRNPRALKLGTRLTIRRD